MTSALDPVTGMMEANQRLARTLAEITQARGKTYTRLGGQAATRFAEQARDLASGKVPELFADASSVITELQRDRDAATQMAVSALVDWQKAWGQAWTAALDQKAATEVFQSLLQPWIASKPAAPTAPEGAKTEARATKAAS